MSEDPYKYDGEFSTTKENYWFTTYNRKTIVVRQSFNAIKKAAKDYRETWPTIQRDKSYWTSGQNLVNRYNYRPKY